MFTTDAERINRKNIYEQDERLRKYFIIILYVKSPTLLIENKLQRFFNVSHNLSNLYLVQHIIKKAKRRLVFLMCALGHNAAILDAGIVGTFYYVKLHLRCINSFESDVYK